MYERIDRGVWLTIPGDRTFFNLLLTSSPAINGYAEYEGNNLLLVSVRVKYMIYLFGMGRIWTVQKIFTVQKKCHTHLVSFITHHGLFVLYIVEIFNCKKWGVGILEMLESANLQLFNKKWLLHRDIESQSLLLCMMLRKIISLLSVAIVCKRVLDQRPLLKKCLSAHKFLCESCKVRKMNAKHIKTFVLA